MTFPEILAIFIKSWEGGYANHPNDKGGPTNMGITIATYRSVFGQTKTMADLKKLTDAQWHIVYKKLFWDKWQADKIEDQSIANLLVDWVWGSGPKSIKLAQGVLGVKQDGVVGPKTLAAVNGQDASTLFAKLWRRRKTHFEGIVKADKSQAVFLTGWMNRLNGIQYGRLLCNTYRTYMRQRQQKVVIWRDGILTEGWENVKKKL